MLIYCELLHTLKWDPSSHLMWKQQNLQYAIIGKFYYGKLDIMELRKSIPNQCGIKGECNIGVLDSRHILIRLEVLEDYVNLLSTATYYIKANDRF